MSRKGKVLVAMSGGIDSTVTALILHNEGYEVVGITMKTWDYASAGSSKKETGCCNLDSFNDARAAAVHHGFPHFILDIREEFGDFVIENFVFSKPIIDLTLMLPNTSEKSMPANTLSTQIKEIQQA